MGEAAAKIPKPKKSDLDPKTKDRLKAKVYNEMQSLVSIPLLLQT